MDSNNPGQDSPNNHAGRVLSEILINEKLITAEQLEEARGHQQESGDSLGDALVSQGIINDDQLAIARSIQMNLPLIDLRRHTIQPRVLKLIPEDMARRHVIIPMDIVNDALMVVMANPENVQTIEDIRAQVRMRIDVGLGIRSDIERAINIHYRATGAIEKQVNQLSPAITGEKPGEEPVSTAHTPVAETLDLLITQAVKDRASDVHIEPQEDRLRIRYRIDGILHDMYSFPLSTHLVLVSRVKILAEMDISEQRRPQDGQFAISIGGNEVDIRAATMDTPHGERVTLRILDKSMALFTLTELGMQAGVLSHYRESLNSPIGMVLVGGPTGSGKTTTLYASINELNRNERNIMTIEDPIEYGFLDINQTQVNAKAGITFAGGLRAIMRHDPDIILVGEIRDNETVDTAVQAALTGHMVLSSIHANDAIGVLFRLMDLTVEAASISSTLVAVVAQRMVRKICPNCRTLYTPPAVETAAYQEELQAPAGELYHGAGCNLCANTGYRGRTGIFELLTMRTSIRKLLRDNAGAAELKETAISEGLITMRRDGMMKARDGITTISEVLRSVFAIN